MSTTEPETPIDLEQMNHTELVLLARWMGIGRLTRAVPRRVLIDAIQEFKALSVRNPIDLYRKKMSTWLKMRWDRCQMQVIKSTCPHCDQCNDAQAMDCFLANRAKFEVNEGG